MLIQQTLIQYLLQKKNLCEIFKVLTIWGNINLFIRPQHHHLYIQNSKERIVRIAKEERVKQALLFGSRAKGTARERSDIDTLYTIDIVDLNTCKNGLLLEDIEKYGRKIFEKV